MRNTKVGFILHMEEIRVQSGTPECLCKAIRQCKSLHISQKVFTRLTLHISRPHDLMEAMMLFLAMGSNFQTMYISLFTKNNAKNGFKP